MANHPDVQRKALKGIRLVHGLGQARKATQRDHQRKERVKNLTSLFRLVRTSKAKLGVTSYPFLLRCSRKRGYKSYLYGMGKGGKTWVAQCSLESQLRWSRAEILRKRESPLAY